MSSNNQPPFEMVCVRHERTSGVLVKGKIYTIIGEGCENNIPCYYLEDFGLGQPFKKDRFAPINPYQSNLTKELAEQALSVGDSVDQPVKQLVNN